MKASKATHDFPEGTELQNVGLPLKCEILQHL